ncbi:uncharacterized protein LOC111301987 [Durio zibethinus]|uniref:Uncharacterized protein LOC111301987 n=1 Tax=Durio zibethinus TaxID=66656 RepID=A0A6P5ZLI0_DURZI|nr:uncharacterized protein LOC111301987 [Durio zibethinus]
MVRWVVWHGRNMVAKAEENRSSETLARLATTYLQEFKQAQALEMEQMATTYIVANSSGGLGVIARDHTGKVLGAAITRVYNVHEASMVEAWAAAKAVDMAISMRPTNPILEGDALNVINSIQSEREDLSAMGHIVADIKEKGKTFCSFNVGHVRRKANKAAHRLANIGLQHHSDEMWIGECPTSTVEIVVTESIE